MEKNKKSTHSPIKIVAILNPFSGTANKNHLERQLCDEFKLPEYQFKLERTNAPSHAKELASKAVKDNYDIVIAIGGDGTINEVASSLINTSVKLAILSMGSGNGFARHLGMHNNFEKTIQLIKSQKTALIDTCTINDIPFINLAGIGFDAKIAYLTKGNLKRGLWQYVKASIINAFTFKPIGAEICIPNKCFYGEYKTIVIANASLYGYNFRIAPLASLNDGEMDVMLFKNERLWRYFLEFPKFISGRLHKSKLVENFKTNSIEIKLDKETFFHVDGEGFVKQFKQFNFKIIPNSLTVIINPERFETI